MRYTERFRGVFRHEWKREICFADMTGVSSAVPVSYNGDYMG